MNENEQESTYVTSVFNSQFSGDLVRDILRTWNAKKLLANRTVFLKWLLQLVDSNRKIKIKISIVY